MTIFIGKHFRVIFRLNRPITVQRVKSREKPVFLRNSLYVQAIIKEIREFWEGVVAQIPKMHSLAMTYGFIVPSSVSVERVSSYFNKFLTEYERKLAPETLRLLFLCRRRKNFKFCY